jgi:hypothetical protein
MQDISLNPQKLAGQCCKLKCGLSYELDADIDARKSLPRVNAPLQALDGDYHLVSSDVLRGTMSFSTVKGAAVGNITLPAGKVREIIDMNHRGTKPATITGLAPVRAAEEEPAFVNMVGEESITRFDRTADGGRRRRGRGGPNRSPEARGGENRGGDNRGGERRAEGRGGEKRTENRGGDNRGGERRAEGRGGDNRGGQNRGEGHEGREARGDNRGGDNRNGERRAESRGGDNRNGENRNGNRNHRGGNRNRGPKPKPKTGQ